MSASHRPNRGFPDGPIRPALAGVTGVNGDDPYGAGPALVAAGPGGNCTGPGCDQTVLSGPLGTCKGASCVTGLGGHFTGAGPKLRQRKPAVITDMFASPPQVSSPGVPGMLCAAVMAIAEPRVGAFAALGLALGGAGARASTFALSQTSGRWPAPGG